jgi:hypothetical protein
MYMYIKLICLLLYYDIVGVVHFENNNGIAISLEFVFYISC